MEPIDLSARPPRSPWERLEGLYFMPRTIDKLRAKLPGGNLGVYKIDGTSRRLLDAIGVREEDLQAVVARATSEEDVAAWLRDHADRSKFDEINRLLSARSYDDIQDKEKFDKNYPHAKTSGKKLLFDLLELDDRAMFASAREGSE